MVFEMFLTSLPIVSRSPCGSIPVTFIEYLLQVWILMGSKTVKVGNFSQFHNSGVCVEAEMEQTTEGQV